MILKKKKLQNQSKITLIFFIYIIMKEFIAIFFKGFIIGIAKLMPGISGSALAITLDCYNQIIVSIANFYKFNEENYKFILNFGIGFMAAIFFLTRLIVYLLNNYYFWIILLFAVIIIIEILKVSYTKKMFKPIFVYIIFIILLVSIIKKRNFNIVFKHNFINLFLLGFIEAISMMIPGISGTAILVSFNIYDEIMLSLTRIDLLYISLPFILGTFIGLFIICKLFKIIIDKNKDFFESISIYFLLFSLIMLLFKL